MKPSTILCGLCLFCGLCVITSCDDDIKKDAKSPVLGSLTFEPSASVAPQDSVTGFITYETKGKNVYKIDFTLSVNGKDSKGGDSIYIYKEWSLVDPLKQQPVIGFRAPKESGIYRVSVRAARINYSTSGPNGEIYGTPSSTSAQLTVN